MHRGKLVYLIIISYLFFGKTWFKFIFNQFSLLFVSIIPVSKQTIILSDTKISS